MVGSDFSGNMPLLLTEEGDQFRPDDTFELMLPAGPNKGHIRTATIHAMDEEILHVRVNVIPADELGMGYFWFFRAVHQDSLKPMPLQSPLVTQPPVEAQVEVQNEI